MSSIHKPLNVIIIGAGIGGLTAAIACRHADPPLDVTVLEKCPKILTIGAGIHIPPNACRILSEFGLLDKLKQAGGYEVDRFVLSRYEDGRTLASKPLRERVQKEYGSEWIAIHRGDYQNAVDVQQKNLDGQSIVHTADGRQLLADVVIGADGLWSHTRNIVLGRSLIPEETGDLAYRVTFSRDQLRGLASKEVDALVERSDIQVWLGPGRHVVFYPLRNHTEYNLVLLVADDLPTGVRTADATVEEMMSNFEGWDPRLKLIMSAADKQQLPLKWKLLHVKELPQWTRGTLALLGDASHPSLPYLGQGAAMAVEDAATLGMLLNAYSSKGVVNDQRERNQEIAELLKFYERSRKSRAEIIVAGATDTRHYYHLPDGCQQKMRDEELSKLADANWDGPCSFNWGDSVYQRDLLAFDIASHLADASSDAPKVTRSRRQRHVDRVQRIFSPVSSTKI
ncbi:hypothetical protein VHEMI09075 [[Torrubiella] hemipterigena]|uniref:FAD-binding domain-containing protein n=1 Tax=[Torrubiella] hemipterigena TaxID=1531966 RepID=A0A0A1TQU7_9HYPO|nr:hypothetical protein VHEMI09075 [[Torrubiella] hemipterigena]